MRADGAGHVVMVVAGHDGAGRGAARLFNGAQQVARVGLAHAKAVTSAYTDEPFFQVHDLEDMPRRRNRLVGAHRHVPARLAQRRQCCDRAGKGAGAIG